VEKGQRQLRLPHRLAPLRGLGIAAKLEKGAHVQVEAELRYREDEKEYDTKKAPARIKHRVAEIHLNRILKLDRAEKQDEPAREVDPSELPADEPTS